MSEKLPEKLVEKMIPSLRELAELVGNGINPDHDALKEILSKVGLDKDGEALDEFEQWCEILQRVASDPDDTKQDDEMVAALQERGISEAPATLAVRHATRKAVTPPEVDPCAINFGILKPGEAANATLKVSGMVRSIESHDKRLKMTLFRSEPGETLVKIMLQAGQAEESLNDEVVLQAEKVEIRVPVTARWAAKKDEPSGTQPLRVCPTCRTQGVHGEGSLFWNWIDKTWGCLNPECPDFYKKRR